MSYHNLREVYIKKLLAAIPANIKPVDYLMDILNISRESVYRRIKCKVPFTYDEMIELSLKLGLSLDEITPLANSNKAIFSHQEYMEDPSHLFLKVLKEHSESISKEVKIDNRISITSTNHLWLIHIVGFENLLKFYYYKWMHQMDVAFLKASYSDMIFPKEIMELSHNISEKMKPLRNSIFIIDKCIFFNIINEIQYYYRRGLLSEDDLLVISKDMERVVYKTEQNILNGTNESGAPRTYYLSSLNIDCNSIYLEYGDNVRSFFYTYGIRPLGTSSKKVCAYHKKWLNSLKKYSVLISASNEEEQMRFFDKQKEYLNMLANGDIIYP
ncbi:hypothetical protein [Prevotella sp. 10(H)]|uniref:hypothetical protein n=1 Tax=Prevotella sp. 10(H) TaxID=1158294 RepID=UPI0004A71BF0|nr:hypothetical protein [Prevotella sp. 10(H)]